MFLHFFSLCFLFCETLSRIIAQVSLKLLLQPRGVSNLW